MGNVVRTPEDFTKIVNQSGFPLQMAVERLVTDGTNLPGWKVLYKEHGWRSEDGQAGFVDLVLEDQNGVSVLVLELKRVREAHWLFLADAEAKNPTPKARFWVTNTPNHGREHFGVLDARTFPESPESMYCVVDGQDLKARPMLERIAAEVSSATEAIALEELPMIQKWGYGLRIYASVIVTTADLLLSSFDSSKVSIATGDLSQANHEPQRWMRFRKHLSSTAPGIPIGDDFDFQAISSAKERQVFVVNALALPDFLRQWRVIADSLRRLR
jgi:hypothetical protein